MNEFERIRREARRRRAHLSTRALLKLLLGAAGGLEAFASGLRARLDPTGGAEEPVRAS